MSALLRVKHYGRVSETPCFSWGKIHRKSQQIVKYYGESKLLRRRIFNTVGSLGWAVRSKTCFFGGGDVRSVLQAPFMENLLRLLSEKSS